MLLLVLLALAALASPTAIRAGGIVDPGAGTTIPDVIVVIENGKITAVGPDVPVPEGVEVLELPDHTLVPGLIDAHTHLCSDLRVDEHAAKFLYMSLEQSTATRALRGAVHAREMLEAGFTTVRDVGNAGNYADVDLARAVAEGLHSGPEILPSGRIIAPFGGQFRQPAETAIHDLAEYRYADSQDEMRRAVRENIHYGAQWIKIVVDSQRYSYNAEDVRFIVEEAARAGVKVAAHVGSLKGAEAAIAGGVASIEHGFKLDDDLLGQAKKAGVFLVPTPFTAEVLRAFGWNEEAAERIAKRSVQRVRTAHQAGVQLVFGTDVMVPIEGHTRGDLAVSYIEAFSSAGLSNAEVLQAMTTTAAELLGLADDRGQIRVGMRADLIATRGDPLVDLSALQQVDLVIKAGDEVYRR